MLWDTNRLPCAKVTGVCNRKTKVFILSVFLLKFQRISAFSKSRCNYLFFRKRYFIHVFNRIRKLSWYFYDMSPGPNQDAAISLDKGHILKFINERGIFEHLLDLAFENVTEKIFSQPYLANSRWPDSRWEFCCILLSMWCPVMEKCQGLCPKAWSVIIKPDRFVPSSATVAMATQRGAALLLRH